MPSTKPFVAPEALAAIDQAAGGHTSPVRGCCCRCRSSHVSPPACSCGYVRYTASFAITLSGPLLLTISSTHDSCCFLQHGAVQGQMLGPTLAPEQQEALMHILMALQQSGEALPPQDLDTVQVCTSHCVSPSSNIAISVPSEDTAQCHAYSLRRSCALHCMQCFTVRLCVDLTKSSGPFAW